MEIWKDIKGYEGLYQVSNLGRVKSLTRTYKCSRIKEHIVEPHIEKVSGYYKFVLWKQGKFKNHFLHRIVAISFLDNPNNYPIINHIDGDKLNNSIDNLEWCTRKENVQHAYKNGLMTTKKVCKCDINDNVIEIYESIKEATRKNKTTHIVDCCKGKRNTAGGFKWKYYEVA